MTGYRSVLAGGLMCAFGLCGCAAVGGAQTVAELQSNPAGVVEVHSKDDLATTYQRTLTGSTVCITRPNVSGDWAGTQSANVLFTLVYGLGAGPVFMNARMTAADQGTDVVISYAHERWADEAEKVAAMAVGKPGC